MVKYNIEWNTLHFMDALKEGYNRKYNLYYIALGEEKDESWDVVYLGQTSKQTVSDRLLGGHDKLKSVITDFDDDIWIGLGRIKKQKLSKMELDQIEKALISFHKPILNGAHVGRWEDEKITICNMDAEDCDYEHDLEEEFTLPL